MNLLYQQPSLEIYYSAEKAFKLSQEKGGEPICAKLELKHLKTTTGQARNMELGIQRGAFYETVMPETVESMWGPVPLRRLPENEENKCQAVSHK